MVYVTENVKLPQRFAPVLDNSDLMGGDPWRHLRDAVEKCLEIHKPSPTVDRIPVIIFGNKGEWACCNEDIRSLDVAAIS
ncbi:unnamed protein product [Didymodactylos carnosus]|uniref:Uncharacterized protein n=1 Tax=Didymodactylos carnosus TaxID=1234261 RepID=A0A816C4A5_9BILA|nr:unnamed protein product [Didymodactylos carnosus]CAF1615645.1 unnamed protein product [Didymodactylos carnosus]CAF4263853.1 unnamed protein product [Didymodactylos carnosus]CAF4501749.1 unnamed protein product [Didymodactylos carnosus]